LSRSPEVEVRSQARANDWIEANNSKLVGDKDHLKVVANDDAAETWLQESDPDGVAFEYEVNRRHSLRSELDTHIGKSGMMS
jgi:hypothetical protein